VSQDVGGFRVLSQRPNARSPDREPTMHIPVFRTFPNDRVSTWVLRLAQVGVLMTLAARIACAQDSAVVHRPANLFGVSVGVPGYGGQSLPLQFAIVGVSVTHIERGHLGFDLSVGTMPRLIADGTPIFGVRAGMVFPIPVTNQLTLLPGAGISGIGNGDGGALGWNLNLSALATVSRSTALRTGVSVHQFSGDTEAVAWLYELGLAWFVD
jgi:hypothetical protein